MVRRALLLVLVTSTAHAETAVPHVATFGRWFVACDNARHCEARGVSESTAADLRLIRDATGAQPRLILTADKRIASPVTIDGGPLDTTGWRATEADGTNLETTDPAQIARTLALARAGHTLSAGDDVSVPLNGLTAALLRMDDVQGSVAPALPTAPRWQSMAALMDPAGLAAATRRGQARALRGADCSPPTAPDAAYALDAASAIVLLFCSMGAYQGSSLVVLAARSGGATVLFTPALPTIATPMTALTEAAFDPATGTLSMSARGRGIADCGLSAQWVWAAGAFQLTQMSYQPLCGGAAPGDWPEVYRTH